MNNEDSNPATPFLCFAASLGGTDLAELILGDLSIAADQKLETLSLRLCAPDALCAHESAIPTSLFFELCFEEARAPKRSFGPESTRQIESILLQAWAAIDASSTSGGHLPKPMAAELLFALQRATRTL